MHAPLARRLRHTDDWRALSTINAYRCLIAVGLLGVQSIALLEEAVTVTEPAVFTVASLLYLAFGISAVICTTLRAPSIRTQVILFTTLDIAFIDVVMFAGAGVTGGLGVLMIVFVVCAAAMLSMRGAIAFAALAAIATLAQESVRSLLFTDAASGFFQAGILGIVFFVVGGFGQWFAQRVRSSYARAEAHAGAVRNLTEINRHIIEQMEIGAVVLDHKQRLQLINTAAIRLLELPAPPPADASIKELPAELGRALDRWLRSPGASTPAIELGGHTLLPSFSTLVTHAGGSSGISTSFLVFLEDAERQNEQAQNLKLAALGRLSAGIAHEIRNPLSAITHASQLLAESPRLDGDDRRLLEMVQRHGRRIDAIVGDVMGFSRRRDGRQVSLRLKPCLEHIMAEYRQHSAAPATIGMDDIDPLQSVYFDPDHLRRIMLNLWQNAERHARRPGTELTVRLRSGQNRTNTYCLDIIDNGPGLDVTAISHVLEPFYTTGNGGTGLGLHVARELCESNGARLTPIADTDGGRFRITFSAVHGAEQHG